MTAVSGSIKIPSSRRPDAIIGQKLVFKRPFCMEFLEFCFERFDVGIWSSAKKWNLDGAINFLIGDLKDRLLFSWDQSECTDTGFKTIGNSHCPLFLKELKRVWDRQWRKRPRFSQSDTLLIDDSPYKALRNPPNTAIFPEPYTVDHIDDTAIGPNGELRAYLKGLAAADDVQLYVKDHPFGQSAITPTHNDWSFYSKVMIH